MFIWSFCMCIRTGDLRLRFPPMDFCEVSICTELWLRRTQSPARNGHPLSLRTAPIISVAVFSFTHTPVLSTLLLSLSAFRFLAPDLSAPLIPAPFLSWVALHVGMTFPFLSVRNPLWTHSGQTLRHFFSQNYKPAMLSVPCCCLHLSKVSVCCPF